ncbi:MAG: hypothetical protein AMXMBFR84_07070 [Candidatus Hydrogenedentota bacterium]
MRWIPVCVMAWLLGQPSQPADLSILDQADPGKIRVLIITGGHDFERDAFFDMFNANEEIVWVEAIHPEANVLYTPEASARFDVIVLYDMVQAIGDEQKANLVRLLKDDGKGLVALHHSIANYQDWPEYAAIVGGRYFLEDRTVDGVAYKKSTWDHDQHFRVTVADPAHPIAKGVSDFDIEDETYNLFFPVPEATPLLTVDHPLSAKVIGWTHTYGKARCAYIQLGHGPTAYANPNFRALVGNAIRWASAKD